MDNDPQSKSNPEKQTLDDNARKFTCNSLDPSTLSSEAVNSFTLATDWLVMNEDSEKKLAYKKFENGDKEFLLITKITKNDGSRTSEKLKTTENEYRELLISSILHIEKVRHEFTYEQNGILFSLKYDDFGGDKPRILEVDSSTDQARSLFDPTTFSVSLTEVTGDMSYYGHRVGEHLG